MYAPRPHAVPATAPVMLRLIGVLDADLVAALGPLERGLVGAHGATILVDVRDLHVLGETEMHALAAVVGEARRAGRDVRLDARSFEWKRIAKQKLSKQPAVDAKLRSTVGRTVILAHSVKPRHR